MKQLKDSIRRAVCTVPVMIYVLVCIIYAERLINGGALIHELYGAAGVSRDVTDGQQPRKRGQELKMSQQGGQQTVGHSGSGWDKNIPQGTRMDALLVRQRR